MIEFPTIVYRGYGPYQRKGGGFNTLGCDTQEQFDAAIADGWFETMPQAIEAHDNPVIEAVIDPVIPVEDAPPTRAELIQKARELGIQFGGRTSDENILRLINERLAK